MEAERKQLMSQKEKENIMTHFCNMDLLEVLRNQTKIQNNALLNIIKLT